MFNKYSSLLISTGLIAFVAATNSVSALSTKKIESPKIKGVRVSSCVKYVGRSKSCGGEAKQAAADAFCRFADYSRAVGFQTHKSGITKKAKKSTYRFNGSDWEYLKNRRSWFKSITCTKLFRGLLPI